MKRLIQILQLDHKWVRVMLSISTIIILGLIFIPKMQPIMLSKEYEEPVAADSIEMAAPAPVDDGSSYFKFDSAGIDTTARRTISNIERPIQVQIVQEKKPFDWKGTITWAIGAINGFVLIFLNIKNLLLKKN